jgi:hypothetical protein
MRASINGHHGMMANMEITGGCLCRKIRFRITAPPMAMRLCWCRVCQFFAAGNASVNVVFPSDAITIEGEPRDYPSVADSGTRMHRRFCADCGTHLFSEAESRPQLIIVRNGALDDRRPLREHPRPRSQPPRAAASPPERPQSAAGVNEKVPA